VPKLSSAFLGSGGNNGLAYCSDDYSVLAKSVRNAYQPEREIVMELRHLRYFVAVAEELSFRRAAHRLHVSHPALSQQVHDLENELGLKLFERNSRRVELTEVGRVFLVGARRALAAAKEAVTQAQEAAKGDRGRLVIGSIGPLTSSFLPVALARFREQRPLVEATALHVNNRAQVEAVLNG
jgi:DNA-binding transcriptional LysR family regulator